MARGDRQQRLATWEKVVATVAGLAFLILLLGIALFVPNPTAFQFFVFRIVLALAAGAFASIVTGFLHIEHAIGKFVVRAGGGLAVFAMIFLINPPHLLTGTAQSSMTSALLPEDADEARVSDRATAPAALPVEPPVPVAEGSAHKYFSGSQHVRSRVTLFSNGRLTGQVTLENDAVFFGFNAYIVVLLLDEQGRELDRLKSSTFSIGGKPPGKAIKRTFEIDTTMAIPELATQVKALKIDTYSG